MNTASGTGKTRFVSHGAHRLAYEVVEGLAGAPVVVLLHALLTGRRDLAEVRAALAGSARLILPDARGHGASAALADRRYTVDDLAAELGAILDAEEVQAAHLVGHDLGGAAAVALAFAQPARVLSLMLIEPALGAMVADAGTDDSAVLAAIRRQQSADEAAADASYKGLADRSINLYFDARWGMGWRDRLPAPRLATIRRHATALAGSLAALETLTPTPMGLLILDAPTLVVESATATDAARVIDRWLVRNLPNARLMAIPAAEVGAPLLSGEAVPAVVAAIRNQIEGG